MPEPPPVIRIVLPLICMTVSPCFGLVRWYELTNVPMPGNSRPVLYVRPNFRARTSQRESNDCILDVDYRIVPGARAANQHVSGRWRFQRLGIILNRPGNQPALASMAN